MTKGGRLSVAWLEGASVAAFMVPALALWLPTGYSYGALLLLLCAIGCAPRWWGLPVARETRWLAAVIGGMALIWLVDWAPTPAPTPLDKPLKYALALPCLLFAAAAPLRANALWRGLAVGACGSGLIAVYQRYLLSLPRAHGFTNAVQFGDLSLLLGLMCLTVLFVRWAGCSRGERAALSLGVLLGLVGSVLSQTRGGWLALGLALPAYLWMLGRNRQAGLIWRSSLALAAALGIMIGLKGPELGARLALSAQEVAAYQIHRDASTSIGQRLEHWRLAAQMGMDRPWQGWGSQYQAEKARRVAAGQAHAAVLDFDHAHQETLDMFARKGIPGVLMLLLFYGVPLAVFWPTAERVRGANGQPDADRLALCMVGTLLPLSYIGFGLTQVFFAHNSGNMFYVFMLVVTHAALVRKPTR